MKIIKVHVYPVKLEVMIIHFQLLKVVLKDS